MKLTRPVLLPQTDCLPRPAIYFFPRKGRIFSSDPKRDSRYGIELKLFHHSREIFPSRSFFKTRIKSSARRSWKRRRTKLIKFIPWAMEGGGGGKKREKTCLARSADQRQSSVEKYAADNGGGAAAKKKPPRWDEKHRIRRGGFIGNYFSRKTVSAAVSLPIGEEA